MGALKTVVMVLEVIASLALILVVLFQSGKESGLSGAISGSAETYLRIRRAAWIRRWLPLPSGWLWLGCC